MNEEDLEALIRAHAPCWEGASRAWHDLDVVWTCSCGIALEPAATDWPTHLAIVIAEATWTPDGSVGG